MMKIFFALYALLYTTTSLQHCTHVTINTNIIHLPYTNTKSAYLHNHLDFIAQQPHHFTPSKGKLFLDISPPFVTFIITTYSFRCSTLKTDQNAPVKILQTQSFKASILLLLHILQQKSNQRIHY
jgi:hypothetical protein